MNGAGVNLPSYAVATPAKNSADTKALISLLLGITGIVGALFMALIGLVLGMAGLVTGTMSRSSIKRTLSTAGIIASSLAILAGLAVWIYAIQNEQTNNQSNPAASKPMAPAVVSADLTTPCYITGFVEKLNVSNSTDSCDMSAFNGPTLSTSTNAYKVYANKADIADTNSFMSLAKQALEKDIESNLAGFKIDSQRVGTFAGSPAYFINVSDKEQGVAVVEAAVMHEVPNGENVFILVHAVNAEQADLNTLETQWQWQ